MTPRASLNAALMNRFPQRRRQWEGAPGPEAARAFDEAPTKPPPLLSSGSPGASTGSAPFSKKMILNQRDSPAASPSLLSVPDAFSPRLHGQVQRLSAPEFRRSLSPRPGPNLPRLRPQETSKSFLDTDWALAPERCASWGNSAALPGRTDQEQTHRGLLPS